MGNTSKGNKTAIIILLLILIALTMVALFFVSWIEISWDEEGMMVSASLTINLMSGCTIKRQKGDEESSSFSCEDDKSFKGDLDWVKICKYLMFIVAISQISMVLITIFAGLGGNKKCMKFSHACLKGYKLSYIITPILHLIATISLTTAIIICSNKQGVEWTSLSSDYHAYVDLGGGFIIASTEVALLFVILFLFLFGLFKMFCQDHDDDDVEQPIRRVPIRTKKVVVLAEVEVPDTGRY